MIEVLAKQIHVEIIQDIQQEIKGIYQELKLLEKHKLRPIKPTVSKHEHHGTITLKGIIIDSMHQEANSEGESVEKKKRWLLLAEKLEEAHHLGIYKEPVNTICRFICLMFPSAKHNTIRKALPYKYKEPNQSKIACRQMKGLTASTWRHERKKKMACTTSTHWPQQAEQASCEMIANSSVTPYKYHARSGQCISFATWLRRCKKKKYNIGIFDKIKKDKAFQYIFRDTEFALWYLEEVYRPSAKELSAVRKTMEIFSHKKPPPIVQ
jgi:hypothetical protein